MFKWVPIEELDAYNLQPAFIKEKVKDLPVQTEHIVFTKVNVSGGKTVKGTKKEIHIDDKVIRYTLYRKGFQCGMLLCSQVQAIIMTSLYFIMQQC